MLATGSWASDDKKLHRHDPRLSVMGPNQIFIIDTHPLLAQNYAKPWNTVDAHSVKAGSNAKPDVCVALTPTSAPPVEL